MKEFLIEVVKNTNGWVIVVVAAFYFCYESYKKYSSDKALDKTIDVISEVSISQTNRIQNSIDMLADRISSFLDKINR